MKLLNKEMEISALIDTINENMKAVQAAMPMKLVIDKDSSEWKQDASSNWNINIPIEGVTDSDVFTEMENSSPTAVLTAGDGYLNINTGASTLSSDFTIVVIKTTPFI